MLKYLMVLMTFIVASGSLFNHPLSLGLLILVQSMITCFISRFLLSSSWISFTLFLVMVGGLMIIFIYMTSICSNEFFTNFKMKMPLQFMLITLTSFLYSKTNSFYDSLSMLDFFNKEYFKIFLKLNMQCSIFSFLYLIFVLIIIINLLQMNKGPLRKKY